VVRSSKAIFFDRDGVINRSYKIDGKPYAPINFKDFIFYPNTKKNLISLKKKGFKLFIITNQPDIGNNKITINVLNKMHQKILKELPITKIYVCKHSQKKNCRCRKPKPYFIKQAIKLYNINISKSFMVGDRGSDIKIGQTAGCETIFIDRFYDENKNNGQNKTVFSLNSATKYILGKIL
jgi:D-glycero-D-manno-heptose 1,7-bisphosphate phosphatase